MVNKRYMWKCDKCVGHEALIIKLLVKKPPGIMSARSTSSVCEQSINQPITGIEKKGYMRKFDACVGREARINKLLLKKPPGLMSASGASLDETLRAIKEKKGKGEM